MNLEKFAERVERTTGPSAEERQLVIEAYNLIFPHELMLSEEEKGDLETRHERTLHRVRFTNYINTSYERASLDAAMTLVPEGWSWALLSDHGKPAKAGLQRTGPDSFAAADSEAATPALALTAASLRARASATAKHPPPSQEAA